MKAAGKIFKLFLLLIASVSILLISLSFILSDQVAEIIIGSVNRNISTKISIGTFRLSLLKKFPLAFQLQGCFYDRQFFFPGKADIKRSEQITF